METIQQLQQQLTATEAQLQQSKILNIQLEALQNEQQHWKMLLTELQQQEQILITKLEEKTRQYQRLEVEMTRHVHRDQLQACLTEKQAQETKIQMLQQVMAEKKSLQEQLEQSLKAHITQASERERTLKQCQQDYQQLQHEGVGKTEQITTLLAKQKQDQQLIARIQQENESHVANVEKLMKERREMTQKLQGSEALGKKLHEAEEQISQLNQKVAASNARNLALKKAEQQLQEMKRDHDLKLKNLQLTHQNELSRAQQQHTRDMEQCQHNSQQLAQLAQEKHNRAVEELKHEIKRLDHEHRQLAQEKLESDAAILKRETAYTEQLERNERLLKTNKKLAAQFKAKATELEAIQNEQNKSQQQLTEQKSAVSVLRERLNALEEAEKKGPAIASAVPLSPLLEARVRAGGELMVIQSRVRTFLNQQSPIDWLVTNQSLIVPTLQRLAKAQLTWDHWSKIDLHRRIASMVDRQDLGHVGGQLLEFDRLRGCFFYVKAVHKNLQATLFHGGYPAGEGQATFPFQTTLLESVNFTGVRAEVVDVGPPNSEPTSGPSLRFGAASRLIWDLLTMPQPPAVPELSGMDMDDRYVMRCLIDLVSRHAEAKSLRPAKPLPMGVHLNSHIMQHERLLLTGRELQGFLSHVPAIEAKQLGFPEADFFAGLMRLRDDLTDPVHGEKIPLYDETNGMEFYVNGQTHKLWTKTLPWWNYILHVRENKAQLHVYLTPASTVAPTDRDSWAQAQVAVTDLAKNTQTAIRRYHPAADLKEVQVQAPFQDWSRSCPEMRYWLLYLILVQQRTHLPEPPKEVSLAFSGDQSAALKRLGYWVARFGARNSLPLESWTMKAATPQFWKMVGNYL